MKITQLLIILILSLSNSICLAQSVSGYVLDQNNQPIPFAKVYVKNYTNKGAVTNIEGKYSFAIDEGNYELIYSSIGFISQTINVTVKGFNDTKQTVYLIENISQLETVEIKTKKKNVGYEIVKHVIAHKKDLARPFNSYTCNLYIKGSETYAQKNKSKTEDDFNDNEPKDVFDEEKKNKKKKIENSGGKRLNLIELGITSNFKYPNHVKEFKTASTKIGYPEQIYLKRSPVTLDCQFNFYDNLMLKENLHETAIVSPLHTSGLLSYKYKLKEIITQGQDTIYKIHISPRSFGTSTMEGDLYIKKHDWVLTKVDVTMHKGNLKVYDDFRIIQHYGFYDSLWLVDKQTFIYKTKYGKETVNGQTNVSYSNYIINPIFPEKYFNNEVGITTAEAYDRDSLYWEDLRPEPLTVEEQRKKFSQDSLIAVYTKKEYLDSVDNEYNRLSFIKIVALGITHRNREKKTQWWTSALLQLVEPVAIGGPRAGPGFNFFKKFENEQWITLSTNTSIGYLNKDFRGYVSGYHRYNPKNFGTYYFYYNHNVVRIIDNAPYLDYFNPANYYLSDEIKGFHNFEVFNGFFLKTEANWERRGSIHNLKLYNTLTETFDFDQPIDFNPYFAFKTDITISYTPGQKYLTEPKKKIILGSKYPTFSIAHTKGWNKVFGSSVDFDYADFVITQELNLGTIGKSFYSLSGGSFLNQDSIYHIDKHFFRQSDYGLYGWLFSDPTYSFQNLEQAYETREWYGQFHYIHHFNGAIVNKIPFMKKTGIKATAGAGLLFLPEYNNFLYQELFFGAERIFKFMRQRIRIGGYAVLSDSNYQPAKLQFKIAFDVMSQDDLKFNF